MSCFKICLNYYQKPIFRVIKGGIKINTDKRLYEGKVASTYTPDWKNIKDSDYGGISDKGGNGAKRDTIKVDFTIDEVKINDDKIVFIDDKGEENTYDLDDLFEEAENDDFYTRK